MRKTILLGAALCLILLGFSMSCDQSGISDVEFAKALLEESADSTGLYSAPDKSAGPDDSLVITVNPIPENPPLNGPFVVTFTFTDYVPSFASNSIVNGILEADVTIDMEAQTVIIAFDGNLTVDGEHEGEYSYTAQLIIYLATGEYEYAGKIAIGSTIHEVTTK